MKYWGFISFVILVNLNEKHVRPIRVSALVHIMCNLLWAVNIHMYNQTISCLLRLWGGERKHNLVCIPVTSSLGIYTCAPLFTVAERWILTIIWTHREPDIGRGNHDRVWTPISDEILGLHDEVSDRVPSSETEVWESYTIIDCLGGVYLGLLTS